MSIRNRVGKISPNHNLLKNSSPETLSGSLHLKNYSRFPGSKVVRFPYKEKNNAYRTGLDVNALYISKLPENEQKREREIVKELAELAQEYYPDYDVTNPRSPFWSNMTKYIGSNRGDVARVATLIDGDNYFDFSEPTQLIQYAFLRVHPDNAPSSKKLRDPRYAKCSFYVNDENVELKNKASLISIKNKFRNVMFTETPETLRIYARLLGFAIMDSYGEDRVNVALEEFIDGIEDVDDFKVKQFKNIIELDVVELEVRDVVRQSLLHSVIRKSRDGSIYKGEQRLADDEKTYVDFLLKAENQEDVSLLKKELKAKKDLK